MFDMHDDPNAALDLNDVADLLPPPVALEDHDWETAYC